MSVGLLLVCFLYWISLSISFEDFAKYSGDKNGLRVLIIQVDDRPLIPNLYDRSVTTYTAVLNKYWAKHNGYDYLYVQLNTTSSKLAHDNNVYSTQGQLSGHTGLHLQARLIHPGLRQLRGQSWGKLVPLSELCYKHRHDYDYIMFLDSDVAMNPLQKNTSLSNMLQHWHTQTSPFLNDSYVAWGNKNIYNSSVLFLCNAPWRDDLPNGGFILVRPSAEPLIRQWWDYNLSSKALEEFEEQDALWYMVLGGDSYNFLINTTTASMIYDPFLESPWKVIKDMWLVHFPNYESNRIAFLLHMLADAGNFDLPHIFNEHVHHIRSHFVLHMDALQATLNMHNRSLHQTLYPYPHNANTPPEWPTREADDAAHRPESSRFINLPNRDKWSIPESILCEGYVFRHPLAPPADTWLVQRGVKRSFPNWLSLKFANWTMDKVLIFGSKMRTEFAIPTGDPMPDLSADYKDYVMNERDKIDYNLYENNIDLVDGCAVKSRMNREIFILHGSMEHYNWTKHSIPNWDTYLALSPTINGTLELPQWFINRIPAGEPIPPCNC